jgi:hypothetical protein
VKAIEDPSDRVAAAVGWALQELTGADFGARRGKCDATAVRVSVRAWASKR